MRWSLLGPAAATLALTGCGGDSGAPDSGARTPEAGRPAETLRLHGSRPPFLLARVRAPVLVHDSPGGRPIARLRRRTPFGEPRTLAVFETRQAGRWLGVHSPVLGNERTGWIEDDPRKLDKRWTRVSLHVDLSRTRVDLRVGRRTVRRIRIAIGSAGTSTPAGRFQVTDKLPASRFPAGAYGCCIMALSARQPNLPPGWPGGDRIAIHGTPHDETIGSASSTGCLRATDRDLRVLMRRVPIGAPVFIRR